MMLEAFQHMTGYQGKIKSFQYRAQNPVTVGEKQQIFVGLREGNQHFVWAQSEGGIVGMTGTIFV